MTKIKPFKALIYNPEKIKDISRVVCLPYDVIPPQKQEYYHQLNPYNFIRILLGKDSVADDRYVRAGKLFDDWQKSGVFIQEEEPAIYFYSQQYNLKGEKKTRYGFIALLRLGDAKDGIFAHENTRSAAKDDRLKLIRQVKANLSPIFVVFQDHKRIISRIADKYIKQERPFIDLADDEKAVHKIWRLSSPEPIRVVQESMAGENIFIADGHHRYEVACVYREEMRRRLGELTGREGFNYILAYFTNTDSRSLTILPVHRLVRLEAKLDMPAVIARLKDNFAVEEVKDRQRFFFLLEKAGESEHILGMYKDRKYWFLRLKNIKILDKAISDKPGDYRRLDVSILNYLVLNSGLGLGSEDSAAVSFSPSAEELVKQVDAQENLLALFLNPVKVSQIMSVALQGEKMPPKSTYFYPKVLSGLVINKFSEDKS